MPASEQPTSDGLHPLERERRRQGLSRRALAHDARVGHVTIWKIETGRSEPWPSTKTLLAITLDVPIDELFPEAGK